LFSLFVGQVFLAADFRRWGCLPPPGHFGCGQCDLDDLPDRIALSGAFACLVTQGGGMSDRDATAAEAAREQLRTTIGFSVDDEIVKLEALKAEGKIRAYTTLHAPLV
jgi:hypothetical protein